MGDRAASETIAQTWEQELVTAGINRGQAQEARRALRSLLEQRFGLPPAPLATQIEQTEDLDRLHSAFDRALTVKALAEFQL
jgi:hypothetical protein